MICPESRTHILRHVLDYGQVPTEGTDWKLYKEDSLQLSHDLTCPVQYQSVILKGEFGERSLTLPELCVAFGITYKMAKDMQQSDFSFVPLQVLQGIMTVTNCSPYIPIPGLPRVPK